MPARIAAASSPGLPCHRLPFRRWRPPLVVSSLCVSVALASTTVTQLTVEGGQSHIVVDSGQILTAPNPSATTVQVQNNGTLIFWSGGGVHLVQQAKAGQTAPPVTKSAEPEAVALDGRVGPRQEAQRADRRDPEIGFWIGEGPQRRDQMGGGWPGLTQRRRLHEAFVPVCQALDLRPVGAAEHDRDLLTEQQLGERLGPVVRPLAQKGAWHGHTHAGGGHLP